MVKMPKKSIKFISEFLVPSLNEERFGERLMWLDKEKEIFQIDWCHKGGPTWTEREADVFVEWDKHKGHYHPEDKSYFTQSKQRFRALLYKLTCERKIIQQQSPNKFMKVYSIGEKKMKRKKRNSTSTASDSSENETFGSSHQDMCDIIDSECECRRSISDDRTKNILEDHSYTSIDYQSGTVKDQVVEFCLVDTIDFPLKQELINNSSEKVLLKWNHPFNNVNNSLASLLDSTNNPSEKVLLEMNYPHNEHNSSLASLQKSTNNPEKVLVKLNYPYEQNPCPYSLQEQINNPLEIELVKLVYPYNELNNNLSCKSADLLLVSKDTTYEDTNKNYQNTVSRVLDPSNITNANLWIYSKENEVPFDDPVITWNGSTPPLPHAFTSFDLDPDDLLPIP